MDFYPQPGDPEYVATNHVCLAVSADGVHCWEKPDLGLVEFRGSKRNNILPPDNTVCSLYDLSEDTRESTIGPT